jgi:hypothetical protein
MLPDRQAHTHHTVRRHGVMNKVLAVMVTAVMVLAFATAPGAEEKKGISLPGDWRSYTHVKSMVIPDKSHGLYGFHHTYVNATGLEAVKKGGGYPEGSTFVTVFYDVQTEKDGSVNQGKKLRYVYMKKDATAKETGGWVYAAFDAEGKKLDKDPKKCYECHLAVKSSDFVFSTFAD